MQAKTIEDLRKIRGKVQELKKIPHKLGNNRRIGYLLALDDVETLLRDTVNGIKSNCLELCEKSYDDCNDDICTGKISVSVLQSLIKPKEKKEKKTIIDLAEALKRASEGEKTGQHDWKCISKIKITAGVDTLGEGKRYKCKKCNEIRDIEDGGDQLEDEGCTYRKEIPKNGMTSVSEGKVIWTEENKVTCVEHGAMLCVSEDRRLWRCPACNEGAYLVNPKGES